MVLLCHFWMETRKGCLHNRRTPTETVLYELMQDGEDVPKQLEVQLINAGTKRQAQEILFNVFNQKQNPINLEVGGLY